MPRPWTHTIFSRLLREELDRRRRGVGGPKFKGDLVYDLRDLSLDEAHNLGFRGDEARRVALGTWGAKGRRELRDLFNSSLDNYAKRTGATAKELRLLSKPDGNISTPDGKMTPFTAGAEPHSGVVLIVEKGDSAVPLAAYLAPRGITVAEFEGHPGSDDKDAIARWLGEGLTVVALTDEDAEGFVIAREYGKGVRRISLAQLEKAAGARVPLRRVTPDFSYSRQHGMARRLTAAESASLFSLGKRREEEAPHRVELNGVRLEYGEEKFREIVLAALQEMVGPVVQTRAAEAAARAEVRSSLRGYFDRLEAAMGRVSLRLAGAPRRAAPGSADLLAYARRAGEKARDIPPRVRLALDELISALESWGGG